MSVYASLPGSIPLPFHVFGASAMDGTASSRLKPGRVNTIPAKLEVTGPKHTPTSPSLRISDSLIVTGPSAFEVLSQSTSSDGFEEPPTSSPRPSDIIVAIRSARVDPAQLIKNLTFRSGSIPRQLTNLVVRAQDVFKSWIPDMAEQESGDEDACFDEEYCSMYDYSEDFSAASGNDMDADLGTEDDQLNRCSDGELSAIVFELSITFHGFKYNTTWAFSTFVKLRNDLISEFRGGDEYTMSHCPHGHRNARTRYCSSMDAIPGRKGGDRVPELLGLSPESLARGGYALPGFACGGFGMLQSTAQQYCPEMERWMRLVIETFPCSQSSGSFLWEPLSLRNPSWKTIGAGKESSGVGCTGHYCEKHSRQQRHKPGWTNFSKNTKATRRGSVGSLDSIKEEDFNDYNNHDG